MTVENIGRVINLLKTGIKQDVPNRNSIISTVMDEGPTIEARIKTIVSYETFSRFPYESQQVAIFEAFVTAHYSRSVAVVREIINALKAAPNETKLIYGAALIGIVKGIAWCEKNAPRDLISEECMASYFGELIRDYVQAENAPSFTSWTKGMFSEALAFYFADLPGYEARVRAGKLIYELDKLPEEGVEEHVHEVVIQVCHRVLSQLPVRQQIKALRKAYDAFPK